MIEGIGAGLLVCSAPVQGVESDQTEEVPDSLIKRFSSLEPSEKQVFAKAAANGTLGSEAKEFPNGLREKPFIKKGDELYSLHCISRKKRISSTQSDRWEPEGDEVVSISPEVINNAD